MHRLILGNPQAEVDHINGDKLDNRRTNLRLATRQQNSYNAKTHVNPTGFRGVWDRGNRFQAGIYVHGKWLSGGSHPTAWEAALAYDRLALRHAGEFAVLNFAVDNRPQNLAEGE